MTITRLYNLSADFRNVASFGHYGNSPEFLARYRRILAHIHTRSGNGVFWASDWRRSGQYAHGLLVLSHSLA